MRVPLIRPLLVLIARLDTEGMRADDQYDDDFREVRATEQAGRLVPARQELAPVAVLAQVKFGVLDGQQQTFSGNAPDSQLMLTLDYHDLRERGLIDASTQEPLLRVNDRIDEIRSARNEVLQRFPNPPGMFIHEMRPGYGLQNTRNILILTCREREQSLSRGI